LSKQTGRGEKKKKKHMHGRNTLNRFILRRGLGRGLLKGPSLSLSRCPVASPGGIKRRNIVDRIAVGTESKRRKCVPRMRRRQLGEGTDQKDPCTQLPLATKKRSRNPREGSRAPGPRLETLQITFLRRSEKPEGTESGRPLTGAMDPAAGPGVE